MRKIFTILAIFLSCAFISTAQEKKNISESILYFRLNQTEIELAYMDNERSIKMIDRLIDSVSLPAIDSIILISKSSPEGPYRYNIHLSEQRACNVAQFLKKRYPSLSPKINSSHTGENWKQLVSDISTDHILSPEEKEKILNILKADISVEARKQRMKQLPFWSRLHQTYYSKLRYSTVRIIYMSRAIPPPVLPEIEIPDIPGEELSIQEIRYQTLSDTTTRIPERMPMKQFRIPILELRTNLLLPGLNAGLEIPVGNHWSVGANYYYPWFWPKKNNRSCYELLGWTLEGRYWFGKNRQPHQRLLGHSIGLNIYGGYYDLEKDFRGMQGEFVSTGIEYRYALPLGKKRWGHLNFSITLGYLYSAGRTYDVRQEGGPLYGDDNLVKFHFFGPTKAEISLTIPIYKKQREAGR